MKTVNAVGREVCVQYGHVPPHPHKLRPKCFVAECARCGDVIAFYPDEPSHR